MEPISSNDEAHTQMNDTTLQSISIHIRPSPTGLDNTLDNTIQQRQPQLSVENEESLKVQMAQRLRSKMDRIQQNDSELETMERDANEMRQRVKELRENMSSLRGKVGSS